MNNLCCGFWQQRLPNPSSKPLLKDANVVTDPNFPSGVYFVADIFKTAIEEALALPVDRPERKRILQLVASWKVRIDIGELSDFVEQEEIMAFSEAFLTWERETESRGRREARETIAFNLLQQGLSIEMIAQVISLTIADVQALQASIE